MKPINTPIAYNFDELVRQLLALQFDDDKMCKFRDRTLNRLKAFPNNRAAITEAVWLVKIPVLRHGTIATNAGVTVYTAQCEYNGCGSEDDISFDRAIKLIEEGE